MAVPFRPPTRIEVAYRREIAELIERLIPNWIENDEGGWLSALIGLASSPELARIGAQIADRMVRWVNVENAKSWKHASRQSQRSQRLYQLLQEEMSGAVGARVRQIVEENAKLISSVPFYVAQHLTREIAAAQQAGARHETMARLMQRRFPTLTKSRIALIARTETAKTSTALTRARAEELDLNWFEWRTAEDARVRPAHEHLDGVLVSWSDLPAPEKLIGIRSTLGKYAPGDSPNCRCYPAPLLSLEDAYANGSVRRKVYHDGTIQRMTRAQFARLSRVEPRVAA